MTLTFATEYEPVDSDHGSAPIYQDRATRDAAVAAARKISGKEAPFGPSVYVLAIRDGERVGHIVYQNGVQTDKEGEI